jgi:hypothetical protein
MQPYTQRSTKAETASNSPPKFVAISITELEPSRVGCRIVPSHEPYDIRGWISAEFSEKFHGPPGESKGFMSSPLQAPQSGYSKVRQSGTPLPWIISVLIASLRSFTFRHELADDLMEPASKPAVIAACSSVAGPLYDGRPFVPSNSTRPPGKASPLTGQFSTA